MTSLRADDGTPLEIKEGIILDAKGTPLTEAPAANRRRARANSGARPTPHSPFTQTAYVWRSGGLLGPLLVLPILVIVVTVALTVMGGFAALAVVVWALFLLRRIFSRLIKI